MSRRRPGNQRYEKLDSLLNATQQSANKISTDITHDNEHATNTHVEGQHANAQQENVRVRPLDNQSAEPGEAAQPVAEHSTNQQEAGSSSPEHDNQAPITCTEARSDVTPDQSTSEQAQQHERTEIADAPVSATTADNEKLPPTMDEVQADGGDQRQGDTNLNNSHADHDNNLADEHGLEEDELESTAKRPAVTIADAIHAADHDAVSAAEDLAPQNNQQQPHEETHDQKQEESSASAAEVIRKEQPPIAVQPAKTLPPSKDPDATVAVVPDTLGIRRKFPHFEDISLPGAIVPVVVPSQPNQGALRRARVNRILIRRRRTRGSHSLSFPIVTTLLVALIIISTLTSGSVGAAYAYYNAQMPLLNGIAQHSLFQTTHIYDRNGKLLYDLYDQQIGKGRRTYVNYDQISPLLVNATVAAEDHTFWTNDGVDPYGITRAAISDLQSHSIVGGGSTITQQLIKKQLFDDQERTFQVKGQEAILATGLTQQYPKWKIMEMYLNTVYYGDINYGIEAAAQDYFGLKPQCTRSQCTPAVAQLNLAQASLLAGLPQSPTYYNPITNKTVALQRQQKVLQGMLELKMITPAQATQAEQQMEKFTFKSYSSYNSMQAPHFVRYLIDEVLIPLFGAQNLVDGGYSIYTTLDLTLEKKVEQIVYDHLYKFQADSYMGPYGPLNQTNNVNNGAAIVINPRNGEILAMDGSASYNGSNAEMRGQDNAAVAMRQPGSSFKPIVYATAFEMGWYPAMIVPDHKTWYPYDPPDYYSPQNYDGTFHTGYPMTIRTAVGNSFNIPAIDTIMYTGIPNVLNMAARLGLTEVANRPLKELGPSLALGSSEVSLLHLTNAYATFANQGVRVPATSVMRIDDNQGRTIYQYNQAHPKGVRALGADVAYLVSNMLSDHKARYHEFLPGNPLELADRPAAAKTGTTDSFRDNWTMGYTPYLTVGVWAGNSNNDIMNNVLGITGAGPIWHDVMEYASQRYNFPPSDFVQPPDVHQGVVSALTGLAPAPGEPTTTDWFIDGTLPTMHGSYYTAPVNTNCNRDQCRQRSNQSNQQNSCNDNNGCVPQH